MQNQSKGNVYSIVEVEHKLIVSLYDGGRDIMPDEFLRQYRSYFELDDAEPLRFEFFGKLGCKLFLSRGANQGGTQLLLTGIFVPAGVVLNDALQELGEMYRMRVVNFDF